LVSCLQVTCIFRKGEQLHPSKQKLMFDGVNRKKNPGLTGPSSLPVGSLTAHYNHETKDWDQSLLACCAQPCLCMEVFCFPCDIFTRIASSISDGKISQGHACNNLAFHALYGGCCCYTCCIRHKLRKRYNIEGNACGDYWAHVCCCCCAITQEWHELQIQEQKGTCHTPQILTFLFEDFASLQGLKVKGLGFEWLWACKFC
jgi:Cys-rich protein (TIGR01571 family)